MHLEPVEPPRTFDVGTRRLAHVADVGLEPGEMVTVRGSSGEFDVTRTAFGFYATGSLNARVSEHGLRAVLCVNAASRAYLLLVEDEAAFERYLAEESMTVLCRLDSDAAVARLAEVLGSEGAAGGDRTGERAADDVVDR